MKRSNRLILLIGLFLAVVAFVGVVMLLNQQTPQTPTPTPPTTTQIVVAATAIPLGTTITKDMVGTKDVLITQKPADGDFYTLPEQVIGQIVRVDVTQGALITSATFSSTASVEQLTQLIDPGLRGMSVQVDQVSGVGTLIKPGDAVDVVLAMEDSDNKNPIIVEGAPTKEGQPPVTVHNFKTIDDLLNNTSVKLVVQNLKVVGTLLPAPEPTNTGTQGAQASQSPSTPTLNGQQQNVILAVTPQQAEIIRFAQLDGNLSLILRSPKDATATPVTTTGITLRQLVDKYGVLPPKIILTTQP